MHYFSMVFLCKNALDTLVSCMFFSVLHMSAAFLRRCVKLNKFQLLHAAVLINVSFKTMDKSEDPRGGASICL